MVFIGLMKANSVGKVVRDGLHEVDEDQLCSKSGCEMVFIRLMKTNSVRKSMRDGLHTVDEGKLYSEIQARWSS
jgi:hypothetical protein